MKFARRHLARLTRLFGYVLIPLSEIEQMERDSASDYAAVKRQTNQWSQGYFNGIADALSKTAANLRRLYVPILLATAILLTATASAAPKPQPESGQQADMVQVPRATLEAIHEHDQKAELALDASKEQTHAAQNSEADALAQLRDAQIENKALQGQIDKASAQSAAFEKDAANEKAKADKLAKEVFWFKLPLAICAALLFVLACLRFEVPTLSPPYGLVATVAAPLIVFSAIMLL